MSIYEINRKFRLDGVAYEHPGRVPDNTGHKIQRFTVDKEHQVIAQVPLAGSGTVEIHGYATFWSKAEVDVVWTDDSGGQFSCWVQADRVRRPTEVEWHGRYLPR